MSENPVNRVSEYEKPQATVNFKDITREAQKKAQGLNYYISELVGKEIVIVKVDLASNRCEAFLGDQLIHIGWKSDVITKRMALIDKFIRSNFQGVRVRVVERTSKKTGKTYLDFE